MPPFACNPPTVGVTSEYMHSGVREDGARILKKLMQMARDEEMLR